LNTSTRVDYEKSKRPDKGVRPDVRLSVNAGFLEHWKAYTTVLNYRDKLFPVRIIINARTVFPRETEKERMAEDTFRNMVGDAGAGKFGSIKQDGQMYGPFFLTVKNGSNLEEVIATDMDAVKAAVLSEGSSFKHYVYSAYGFSGSGKTRTLIHNPDDRQTRDKPVLELVTNALKTLTDCSIDMYINDLYGEINDGGCTEGGSGSSDQKYEKMTCYSYEDLIQGISNMTKHVPVDRTIMNKHLIQINLHDGVKNDAINIDKIPQLLNTFAESDTFKSKVRHDFGDEHAQRLHIRMTPNNANSSRAHTFIRLVIRKSGKIVGKVTLIDMAGSEDVQVIQQSYFSNVTIANSDLADLHNLQSSKFNPSAKGATTSMVQTWAKRHIKDDTKPSFDDIYKLLGEMALVSEESVTQKLISK
jgi:hypothetical protein